VRTIRTVGVVGTVLLLGWIGTSCGPTAGATLPPAGSSKVIAGGVGDGSTLSLDLTGYSQVTVLRGCVSANPSDQLRDEVSGAIVPWGASGNGLLGNNLTAFSYFYDAPMMQVGLKVDANCTYRVIGQVAG